MSARVWVVFSVQQVGGKALVVMDVAGTAERAEGLRAESVRCGLEAKVWEREVQS